MRGHSVLIKACIDARFEHLDLLSGDLGPAQSADQLIGFSTEHRAGDHFNTAGGVPHLLRLRGYQKRAGMNARP